MNKKLRRVFVPLVGIACLFKLDRAWATAAGICTTVSVGTAATTVLAANASSYPRKRMWVMMTTNMVANGAPNFAWCTIGGTAANNVGYMLHTGSTPAANTGGVQLPNVWDITPVQQSASSFPQIPNGALSCIANAASQFVTGCVY